MDCIGTFRRDEFEFGAGANSGVFAWGSGDGLRDCDRHDRRGADSRTSGVGLEEIVGSEQRGEAGGGAEATTGQGRRQRG